MNELKFKNIENDRDYRPAEKGILIKKFLTASEFYLVYTDMMEKKNEFDVYFTKIVQFGRLATNIDFEDVDDMVVYDYIVRNELPYEFQINLEEYNTIDKMMANEKSLYNIFSELNTKLESLSMLGNMVNTNANNKPSTIE